MFNNKIQSELVKNATSLLTFLENEDKDFILLVQPSDITFNPQLPEGMLSNEEVVPFHIINYTKETFNVDGDNVFFEAGFGSSDNMIGSVLEISIENIFRIIIDNDIVYQNPYFKTSLKKENSEDENRSMNAFLNNKSNSHFFK